VFFISAQAQLDLHPKLRGLEMLIPDPFRKTVRVPVKIINGVPCLDTGDPLPKFYDGFYGELIVPEFAFSDTKLLRQFSEGKECLFLPKDTKLAAQINPSNLSNDLSRALGKDLTYSEMGGIGFELKEDLGITLRGTKLARLKACVSYIPSLKKEANSVNHAYTLISQVYEPERMSHAGNVFTKIFYHDGVTWIPLGTKRNSLEDANESKQ